MESTSESGANAGRRLGAGGAEGVGAEGRGPKGAEGWGRRGQPDVSPWREWATRRSALTSSRFSPRAHVRLTPSASFGL
jgi:hypothetical protein